MNIFVSVISLLCVFLQPASAQLFSAKKLIVIITADWNSSNGAMYRFDLGKNHWKKQQQVFSVSVGEEGLGWGEGVHPYQQGMYMKREGDHRSPSGIFILDTLFYGTKESPPSGMRYPYRPLTEFTRCVDDPASALYNMIVEENHVKKDWNSAEAMKKIIPDYTYVLVMKHNPEGKKGKGSCIFIHTKNIPTVGCTSMNEEDMLSLLHWLDPKRSTVVVQLPMQEYQRFRTAWGLPELTSP